MILEIVAKIILSLIFSGGNRLERKEVESQEIQLDKLP
jgi:hypothetical protein